MTEPKKKYSSRTDYRRRRQEMIDKLLFATIQLMRMTKIKLEKVPLPTLKLLVELAENPYTPMGKEKLKKISQLQRKGSFSYYVKKMKLEGDDKENDT